MTKLGLALIVIAVAGCSSGASTSDAGPDGGRGAGVVINEVFASGSSATTDPDWAELENLSAATVNLSGYQVRDKKLSDLYALPAGTMIEAGGYLVIYCDDQAGAADGGTLEGVHTPWKLSASKGDELHLLDPAGVEVDATTFGVDLPSDKSWGRLPDGTGAFIRTTPTQGRSNL
jgi:hypothetical protein